MKFLLINTNQIVQKLVEITAKKAGAQLTSITESSKMGDLTQYDYVIIDDDCLLLDKKIYLDNLKDKRKCLIYNKGSKRIEGFDDYIQKPFLPTSILDIFTEQLKKNPQKTLEDSELSLDEEHENISLDNLESGLSKIDSLLEETDEMLASNTPENIEAESTPASEENPESIESLDTLEEKEAEETSKANMPSDDLENLGDLEDSKELGDVEDSTNLENLENMEEADMPTDEVDSQTAEATEDLAGLDDLGESVAEEASLESGDDLEVTQEVESDEMSADTALDENKELADVSEPLESENTEQIEQDEIAEDTSNDLLNDVEALALDETPQEEESTQSPETILDKDQVDEVSQALHSLDESAQVDNGEDFIALKEPDVAQALGEKIDMPEPELEQDTIEENDLSTEDLAEDELEQNLQDESPQANTNISTQEAKNSNESSQEFVKNMIASSVQSSITSLHTDNLKSMLDGLEVTINISFKDKSK